VALVETGGTGTIPANTTVSSVTNATTIVLSQSATKATSNIKYTLARLFNGYANNSYTNTDWSGATVASHANADNSILNWNSNLATIVAQFDSMVQIVDLDAAINDSTVPTTLYSWWSLDGLHLNGVGSQRAAQATWLAAARLSPPQIDVQPMSNLAEQGAPFYQTAPYIKTWRSGGSNVYLPDGAVVGPAALLYTAVAGDMFFVPYWICEASLNFALCRMDQANAGTSVIRVGLYDDCGSYRGYNSYPGCLIRDMGNYTMSTATSQTVGSFYYNVYPGLVWLAMCVQSVGTASTFYTMYGTSYQLPGWNGSHLATAANVMQPCGYKVTSVAAGALPNVASTAGALCGAFVASMGPVCPLMGVTANIQ
jgi:hypothetical protein